jgi:primosomal protein N' (replication factor Y)
MSSNILNVAIPSPLYHSFDYLAPADVDTTTLRPGMRIRVPFGPRRQIGILLSVASHSDIDAARLKPALEVLDDAPVITPDILAMVKWASGYYHYPVGEALAAALPALLRRGESSEPGPLPGWRLTASGQQINEEQLARAPRQRQVITQLLACPEGLPREAIDVPASILNTLKNKAWIEAVTLEPDTPNMTHDTAPSVTRHTLNPDQQAAVDTISAQLTGFSAFLLDGVTGSGKTEVYLRLIEQTLTEQKQALVLVPEIGLTPQLVKRFRGRFSVPLAVLHSGLTDRERLAAWQRARSGEAPIIIGTRSAIFTPLATPGLLIVDEEHDPSLKQQDGFRYSARDLAVWRARQLDCPVILGTATPSLESIANVEQQRYQHLRLPERTGSARMPLFRVLNVRRQPMEEGLSPDLLEAIRTHLDDGNQILLFLNRRGFAPTLLCHQCGWVAECRRCDARLTLHQQNNLLRCHHCGSQRPVDTTCPECQCSELRPLGQGTERVEQALAKHFPNTGCVRIDRDTTRHKGALDTRLERAHSGQARILLGTQMLAKGHHFPGVTLVGILNADQGLFGTDFRASERMAQQIIQVAGRAGRDKRPGEVIIQTHHPEHPLLQLLVSGGYPAFARAALAERRAAGLPPYSHIALVRAEATRESLPMDFLAKFRDQVAAQAISSIEAWGPVPAGMERRGGKVRAQLLLQTAHRGDLQRLLGALVPQLEQDKLARQVRWSVDVDPVDTF